MKKRFSALIVAFLGLILVVSACVRRPSRSWHNVSGTVWGTVYHITYRSPVLLDDSIAAVMAQVGRSLSAFDPASAVSRINRSGSTSVKLTHDPMLARVMKGAARVWRASGGAFDPTVGPLVCLWGFGWDPSDGSGVPSQESIDSVMDAVGFGGCSLAPDGTLYKPHPDTQLDFSAIAKGLGCDAVGEMLARNAVDDYMVEIGGEIAVAGVNSHGEPWHLMVETPDGKGHRMTMVEMSSGGIATSGNYRNYRDTDKGRVGHSISPLSGYPVTTLTRSATVTAPDCMTADALATACMVMEAEDALAMIDSLPGTAALLAVEAPDSGLILMPSARWTHSTPSHPAAR